MVTKKAIQNCGKQIRLQRLSIKGPANSNWIDYCALLIRILSIFLTNFHRSSNFSTPKKIHFRTGNSVSQCCDDSLLRLSCSDCCVVATTVSVFPPRDWLSPTNRSTMGMGFHIQNAENFFFKEASWIVSAQQSCSAAAPPATNDSRPRSGKGACSQYSTNVFETWLWPVFPKKRWIIYHEHVFWIAMKPGRRAI